MDTLLFLKAIHILSAAVLFGTGLGIAFFMWRADRSGDVTVIAATTRQVVLADWLFTAPAVIVQPATGLLLVIEAGYALDERWLLLSIGLYVLAGACWLPVVWLQVRMKTLAEAAHDRNTPLPAAYHRAMRAWFTLGWPAFGAVIAIFFLMVFRPSL